jgi:exopolysaccharide production protein ExoQ
MAPVDSLRKSVLLTTTTIFAAIVYKSYPFHLFLKSLIFLITAQVVWSMVFWIIAPQYVIMTGVYEGVFSGIFSHKNLFSRNLVVGILCLIIAMRFKYINQLLGVALALLFIVFLIITTSAGGVLIALVLFGTFILVDKFDTKKSSNKLILFSSVLLILILGFLLRTEVFGVLGKSSTLTGRIPLWVLVIGQIMKKPFLGYGYYGFWDSQGMTDVISRYITWDAPNAHNGYLEVMLQLGIVGLVVLIIGILFSLFKAVRNYKMNKYPIYLYSVLIIMFMLISNIIYTQLLVENEIYWMLYTYAIIAINDNKLKE